MKALPRLLYFGEVPVESSYHGSALLYRLLYGYPPDQLRILEREGRTSMPERKLTGVHYEAVPSSWTFGAQFLRRRLPILFWAVWYFLARIWAARALRRFKGFRPEAVLTVHEGSLWLGAVLLAQKLEVPLHIIFHDDWFREMPSDSWLRRRLEEKVGQIYREAASRLCVSPYMEEEFRRRYGAAGDVLYPSRSPVMVSPVESLAPPAEESAFTIAYGGSTFDGGYGEALRQMAELLASRAGQLLIFGPLTAAAAESAGLHLPCVKVCGLVRSAELIARFRNEADVLFVPMSFGDSERENMSLSFPSKLADYTAAGMPLLIYGPDYSSAVRWARANPGCAEVVDQPDEDSLGAAVDHLIKDRAYRLHLGAEALRVGNQYFSPETATELFRQRLLGA